MPLLLAPQMARSSGLSVGRDKLFNHREDLLFEETGESSVSTVEFVAAVVTQHIAVGIVRDARLDEHPDGHRHLAAGDQIVQHRGSIEKDAVQAHKQAGRRGAVILYRHIDLPFPPRLGIDLRVGEFSLENQSLERIRHRDGSRIIGILRIVPEFLRSRRPYR